MSAHALLSPSKRYRWANCPGSIREEKKYPEPPSSASAIDGTHTHTLLENCIVPNEQTVLLDPKSFIGRTLKDHEGPFVVERDRCDRVTVALDYIGSRMREHDYQCEVISERKVNPDYLLGRDDMGGTVDVQIIGGDTLELIDYKDGMSDAWESAELQLEQYAYGVLSGFEIPRNLPYPIEKVRMTVIQPKLALKGGQAIRYVETTVKALLDNVGTIVVQAHLTDDPNAPLIAGELQCKYCPVTACSARAQKAINAMGISEAHKMFTPIESTENTGVLDLAQQSADKDPNSMTPEQLAQILEAAPLIRQLIDAVETEALKRMKTGVTVPGFKVVNGRGSRKWALKDDEMAEKLIKMGIPKGEVYESKLVSPAKVEKLKWTKKKGGVEVETQLSERQLKTLEKEYIAYLTGSQSVVPEADSRPALTFDAAPMFTAVQAPATEAPTMLPDFLQTPSWLLGAPQGN